MTRTYLIELTQLDIFEQLQLEEALLRADSRNFCVINKGSKRSIVMGSSGVAEELLHLDLVEKDRIPVIRRYSGGGTVIVDENTLFVTFLFSKETLSLAFPESILRWSADLYKAAWHLPEFDLRENDYVLNHRKCGGNAQYIQKDRWMHHTSFLWDYAPKNMEYLQLPKRRPAYRKDRPHEDFLCRLKEHRSIEELIKGLKRELVNRFDIYPLNHSEVAMILERPHRKTSALLA
jgi:lipoate-protein ligase A